MGFIEGSLFDRKARRLTKGLTTDLLSLAFCFGDLGSEYVVRPGPWPWNWPCLIGSLCLYPE